MRKSIHGNQCVAILVSIELSASVFGQASFQVLSDPSGEFISPSIEAVSSDGRVLVGRATTPLGQQAFRWTQESGFTGLGYLHPSDTYSMARGVSADGLTIVGDSDGPNGMRAFRWTFATGMQALPIDTNYSVATGTSFDGSVIVGWANDENGHPQAFRWSETHGMQWLGHLSTAYEVSIAYAVSADGNHVAGVSKVGKYQEHAFRWTPATGMQDIHGGGDSSTAYAVSADGTMVVGVRWESPFGCGEAYRWTQATGMVGLGDLPTGGCDSLGHSASASGELVVGYGTTLTSGSIAFLWDSANGMRSLKDALQADYGLDLTGIWLGDAKSISLDGSTITNGNWIVRLGTSIGPKLVDGSPRDATIDARQDFSITGVTPQGISSIRVSFNMPVVDAVTQSELSAESFTITDTNGTPPPIIEVLPAEGLFSTYEVVLADRITPGAWTTLVASVTNTNGGAIQGEPFDRMDIGFLPCDVTGDGTASALDILALIDSLNAVTPRPPIQTDINRSNATTPADILRLIDLLNGVNTSHPWLGVSLPPRP